MAGTTNLSELIKSMKPELNEGEYVFVSIKNIESIPQKDILCMFKEKEGYTLVLQRQKADELRLAYDYVAAWISLTVHSSLEAVGLTAAFSNALGKHGVSCNVVAAYYHDHIFVDKKDADKAMKVLGNLSNQKNKQ